MAAIIQKLINFKGECYQGIVAEVTAHKPWEAAKF